MISLLDIISIPNAKKVLVTIQPEPRYSITGDFIRLMPTKGRDISMKEKRGRSPLLPRKLEIGQQMKTLNHPPTQEKKNALASTESRKVPIYDKHTVSSSLYALNTIKQSSVDHTKLVSQSKVMSGKSKFNDKKVTNTYMNTTGSTKTKDVRSPYGKKQTRQQANGFGSKNPRLFEDLSLSKHDHTIVTKDKTVPFVNSGILENCDMQCMDRENDDILTLEVDPEDGGEVPLCEPPVPTCLREDQSMAELDTCSQDSLTVNEPHVSIEHTDDDHDDMINQQDEPDMTTAHGSDYHFEVDQENQVKNEYEEPEPKELEREEGGEEVPKEEDRASEMVAKNHEVVAHRKMDTAAYNDVMEVTRSKFQQQRWNRVKALIGAFETIISLECDALQKSIKQY